MAMKRPGIYAPLSAYYFDDTAIMEAGEDAELLYVRMLAYAARQMEYEGFISDRVITSRLGILSRESGNGMGTVPGTDAGSRAGVLAELGLLSREPGGYRITGWLKWNKSAAEVGKERARDRVRKRAPDVQVSGTDTGTGSGNGTGTDAGVGKQRPDHIQTRPYTDQTLVPAPRGRASDAEPEGSLTTTATATATETTTAEIGAHVSDYPAAFAPFWDAYPRKAGKRDALKAWTKATRRASPTEIADGAARFASDPNLPEEQFIPYPSKWLNGDHWEDGPLPDRKRPQGRAAPADRWRAAFAELDAREHANPLEIESAS